MGDLSHPFEHSRLDMNCDFYFDGQKFGRYTENYDTSKSATCGQDGRKFERSPFYDTTNSTVREFSLQRSPF